MEEEHNFDRRVTDVNLAALATRMSGIEGRVEVLEREHKTMNQELRANTELTRQTHGKVEDVHEALMAAKGGFKLLEGAAKIAKPLVWLLVLIGTVWGIIENGKWPTP